MKLPNIISELSFRKATIKDIDYIAEILIQAEKSSNEFSPMQKIFELSSEEYFMFIKNVLEEEVPGSEYFCENFILVFHKSEFVGGIAAWIEGNGNQSSNFVKAPLLSYYLGIEKWIKVQTDLELLTSIMHQRQAGTLQIDAGYINPKFQGNSIPKVMISYGINFFENEFEKLKKVQVVTIVENVKGLKSLEKLGFKIANKKQSNNQKLIGLISGTGFYQLELDLIKYKNAKYGQK